MIMNINMETLSNDVIRYMSEFLSDEDLWNFMLVNKRMVYKVFNDKFWINKILEIFSNIHEHFPTATVVYGLQTVIIPSPNKIPFQILPEDITLKAIRGPKDDPVPNEPDRYITYYKYLKLCFIPHLKNLFPYGSCYIQNDAFWALPGRERIFNNISLHRPELIKIICHITNNKHITNIFHVICRYDNIELAKKLFQENSSDIVPSDGVPNGIVPSVGVPNGIVLWPWSLMEICRYNAPKLLQFLIDHFDSIPGLKVHGGLRDDKHTIQHIFNYANSFCLRRAAMLNNVEMVKILLENGANVDAWNGAPLRYSITNNNMELFKILLEKTLLGKSSRVNWIDSKLPLRLAAELGRSEMVRLLIEAKYGTEPFSLDLALRLVCLKHTILSPHGAALNVTDHDRAETVKILLKNGAHVNVKTGEPLRNACRYGFYKTVKVLIVYGANIKIASNRPLYEVSLSISYSEKMTILNKPRRKQMVDDSSDDLYKISRPYPKIFRLLLDCGADPYAHNSRALK